MDSSANLKSIVPSDGHNHFESREQGCRLWWNKPTQSCPRRVIIIGDSKSRYSFWSFKNVAAYASPFKKNPDINFITKSVPLLLNSPPSLSPRTICLSPRVQKSRAQSDNSTRLDPEHIRSSPHSRRRMYGSHMQRYVPSQRLPQQYLEAPLLVQKGT